MSIQELSSISGTTMDYSSTTKTAIQSLELNCQDTKKCSEILVVDDEEPARKSIVFALRELGYHNYQEANNAEKALELIEKTAPDIVLADIKMPGLSGIELLKRCQTLKNIPVFIFISGYDSFEYAQKAIQLNAHGYLLKPFDEEELSEVLDNAWNRTLSYRKKCCCVKIVQILNLKRQCLC